MDCPVCNGEGCKPTYVTVELSQTAARMLDIERQVRTPEQDAGVFRCQDGKVCMPYDAQKYLTADIYELSQFVPMAEKGLLPEAGGLNDQPATYVEALAAWKREEARIENRIRARYGNR